VAPARDLAREKRAALYLVGGAVRDLLLGRPSEIVDVDLVVESDAVGFARELARRTGATVKFHGRFGTAVLKAPSGERLDVATARAEQYERPGALPRVQAGTIEDDLARRDFTVNAMAIEIARSKRPRLLDPFGGREDLSRGRVRMLHPRSPVDDPTRAFRAVRYANRLGFRIERSTRRWIREAIESGVLSTVSGDRVRREIALLFSEKGRAAAAQDLAALRLAAAVHPSLRYDGTAARRLRAVERLATQSGLQTTWLVYLLTWMGETDARAAEGIAARLNLPRAAAAMVRGWRGTWRRLAAAAGEGRSRCIDAAETVSDDELLAAAAQLPSASRRRLFEARRAGATPSLTIRGRDLLAAGIAPGPAVGRALSATLSARREGAIRPEEELSFALKAARS
jgi:tRNA nucleotidyltransferase (CCA-adding enzyme)